MSGSPLPTQRGFTLVEVMVVLVIIAVMTGLAVVGISQVGSTDARQNQSNLLAWLNRLADGAVLDGGVYGLDISPQGLQARVWYGDRWRQLRDYEPLQIQGMRFSFRADLTTPAATVAAVVGQESTGVTNDSLNKDNVVLVFLPTGMSLPAGELLMTDEHAGEIAVSWAPNSGFSVVQ